MFIILVLNLGIFSTITYFDLNKDTTFPVNAVSSSMVLSKSTESVDVDEKE
jgi:hypothetical protein